MPGGKPLGLILQTPAETALANWRVWLAGLPFLSDARRAALLSQVTERGIYSVGRVPGHMTGPFIQLLTPDEQRARAVWGASSRHSVNPLLKAAVTALLGFSAAAAGGAALGSATGAVVKGTQAQADQARADSLRNRLAAIDQMEVAGQRLIPPAAERLDAALWPDQVDTPSTAQSSPLPAVVIGVLVVFLLVALMKR